VDDVIGDTILLLLEARTKLVTNGTDVEDLSALAVTILKRRASNLRRSARSVSLQVSSRRVEATAAAQPSASAGHQQDSIPHPVSLGRRQAAIVATIIAGGTSADAARQLGIPQKEVLRIMRHLAVRMANQRILSSESTPPVTRPVERSHVQSMVDLPGEGSVQIPSRVSDNQELREGRSRHDVEPSTVPGQSLDPVHLDGRCLGAAAFQPGLREQRRYVAMGCFDEGYQDG
jgi:hypothetical protein